MSGETVNLATPATASAHPLRLRLVRKVTSDDLGVEGDRRVVAGHGFYEGARVAMNEQGAVSVQVGDGRWLGIKPDEMRWLDFRSAEAQAARANGLAALIDHVALDAEHDRVSERSAADERDKALDALSVIADEINETADTLRYLDLADPKRDAALDCARAALVEAKNRIRGDADIPF